MSEIGCRAARRWLQVPDDLLPSDEVRLQHHVRRCSRCRMFAEERDSIDTRLRLYLGSASSRSSVTESVRDILVCEREGGRQRRAAHAYSHRKRHVLYRLLSIPVVICAALAALIGPQVLPDYPGGTLPSVGAAWRLRRPQIGFPLAVDMTRAGHLLVGASGQVYQSWNGGDTWHPLAALPSNLVVRAVAIDRTQPSHYLVATKHSVYLSTDRGRHWREAVGSLPGAMNMFLLQDPRRQATFYVGPSVLWRSIDRGQTWTRAGTGSVFAPDGIQALTVMPNDRLATGIWGGGIAISRDGGRSWQRQDLGLSPNVMDVVAQNNGSLWAATDRGVYQLKPAGSRWERSSAFFATSLLVRPAYQLAGSNNGLYRSTDGGKHWSLSMRGLPLDPYVYGFDEDPFRAGRVYVSVNSDGLFRSDDGGRSWTSVNAGLPLSPAPGGTRPVLFLRGGALWTTDGEGTDPGVLTVERDVTLAAAAPDGAAVVYASEAASQWAVRALNAGGSAARTLAAGRGDAARQIEWAPDSALVAVVMSRSILVSDLSRVRYVLPLSSRQQLIGWSADGDGLLVWNVRTGRLADHVLVRAQAPWTPFRGWYPQRPLLSPGGNLLAFISRGWISIEGQAGRERRVAPVSARCRLSSWSDDAVELLTRCGRTTEKVRARGHTVVSVQLSPPVSWLAGSHTDLLFFAHGRLWRLTPHRAAVQLVRDAYPVSSQR